MSAIEDITTLQRLAVEHGIDPDLLEAYADCECLEDPEEAIERFQENYQGTFDKLEDWAYDIMESTGDLNSMPERLRYYFDYAAFARDCELGGDIYTIRHGYDVAVFWNR